MKRIHSNTTEISHSPHKRIKVETQTTEVEYDSDATEIVEETDDETTTIIYVDSRIYLTKVQGFDDLSNTWSMSLQDIFHAGELECMLQLNYMLELGWMMGHLKDPTVPITFVHGLRGDSKAIVEAEGARFRNVKLLSAPLPIPYGTHHTKAMFLFYKDGALRVVIHTANMIARDWRYKSQGIWMSPLLDKKLPTNSTSAFEDDLLSYLTSYGNLGEWIARMQEYDFSPCKAVIIASSPGRHSGANIKKWGHLRLRSALQDININDEACRKKSTLIAQFSSIGSLGTTDEWLQEFANSLSAAPNRMQCKQPGLRLVFPTVENVRLSLEGYAAGNSIPFDTKNWTKQTQYMWPRMSQWRAVSARRERAMPHIKTFTRISDNGNIAWFLLTSANLSKAAWGALEKKGTQLTIRSYELGVLVHPELFKTKETHKVIMESVTAQRASTISTQSEAGEQDSIEHIAIVPIRLPYDYPLTPYGPDDEAWTWDRRLTKPDSLGNVRL